MPLVSMRQRVAGGKVPAAFGVPVDEIQLGIRHGARQVHADTDCRLAMTAAVREALLGQPEEFDPHRLTRASHGGTRDLVAERMRQFGRAGQAGAYEPRSLDQMRQGYADQTASAAT